MFGVAAVEGYSVCAAINYKIDYNELEELKKKKQRGYLYTKEDGAYILHIFTDRNKASEALCTERFAGYRQISGTDAARMFGVAAVEGYSVCAARYNDNEYEVLC